MTVNELNASLSHSSFSEVFASKVTVEFFAYGSLRSFLGFEIKK